MGIFLFLAGIASILFGALAISAGPTDIQIGIGTNAVLGGLILIGQSAILGRINKGDD